MLRRSLPRVLLPQRPRKMPQCMPVPPRRLPQWMLALSPLLNSPAPVCKSATLHPAVEVAAMGAGRPPTPAEEPVWTEKMCKERTWNRKFVVEPVVLA